MWSAVVYCGVYHGRQWVGAGCAAGYLCEVGAVRKKGARAGPGDPPARHGSEAFSQPLQGSRLGLQDDPEPLRSIPCQPDRLTGAQDSGADLFDKMCYGNRRFGKVLRGAGCSQTKNSSIHLFSPFVRNDATPPGGGYQQLLCPATAIHCSPRDTMCQTVSASAAAGNPSNTYT